MSEGSWQRIIDPGLDWVNEVAHKCAAPPSIAPETPHGATWACACGRSSRLNRRSSEVAWVSGGPLNTQQVQEQVFPLAHSCQLPALRATDPIGNGSTWLCGDCSRTYRVNRRGEHVSWVSAN